MRTVVKIFLTLLVAIISPVTSAIVLGEGRILSHVGEPFSADIVLSGDYSKDVMFFQVRKAECRSSVIAASVNGCDSLYEGQLSFSIMKRADDKYFLKVTGEKDDELFYRIVIKSVSPVEGVVFNAFEFLPEFSATSEVQTGMMDTGQPVTKVAGEKVAGDENVVFLKHPAGVGLIRPKRVEQPDKFKKERKLLAVTAKTSAAPRLEINKYGEYADDIHALQKENGEIEEQIALLEKHISLLKEVIRLKGQIAASMVPETSVVAPARAPVHVSVLSQPVKKTGKYSILGWILLALIFVLLTLIVWMYRKQVKLTSNDDGSDQTTLTPPPLNEIKPLDLTSSFVKPRW